jgi:hypothetical protein
VSVADSRLIEGEKHRSGVRVCKEDDNSSEDIDPMTRVRSRSGWSAAATWTTSEISTTGVTGPHEDTPTDTHGMPLDFGPPGRRTQQSRTRNNSLRTMFDVSSRSSVGDEERDSVS